MEFKLLIDLLKTNENSITFDIQGDNILGLDKSIINSLRK